VTDRAHLETFLTAIDASLHQKHKGAHNELVACAWLLRQGYEVFRAVSQHGVVDLIAIKGGAVEYFDVKTLDWAARLPPYTKPEVAKLGVKFLVIRPDGSIEIHASRVQPPPPLPKPQPKRPTFNCQECGAAFEVKKGKHFCSHKCGQRWRRTSAPGSIKSPLSAPPVDSAVPPAATPTPAVENHP
jgi:hypothetical protein